MSVAITQRLGIILVIVHCLFSAAAFASTWQGFGAIRAMLLLVILAMPLTAVLSRRSWVATTTARLAVYVLLTSMCCGSAIAIIARWHSVGFDAIHKAQGNFGSFVRDVRADAALSLVVVERFPVEIVWRSKGVIKVTGTVFTEESLMRLQQLGKKHDIVAWDENIVVRTGSEMESVHRRESEKGGE